MRILGIDTAGPVIGVALVGEGAPRLWSERVVRGADARLAPALAEMIAGVTLDAVAVSVGPGAFTSLRVGVASALGVALSRGVPVVAVSSLEARAVLADGEPGHGHRPRVLSLLDARKGRVYAALYVDGQRIGEEVDIPPEQAVLMGAGDYVAIGEGAGVFQALIEAAGGRIHPQALDSPALVVARMGVNRIDAAVPAEAVRLNYIRPSDAKLPGT